MNTSLTRRVAIAAVALVASVGFVVLGPSPVLAHSGGSAVPSNNYGHWWATDGCSWVPDSGVAIGGGYYDSNHACIHHDGCYRNRWGGKTPVTSSSRTTCTPAATSCTGSGGKRVRA